MAHVRGDIDQLPGWFLHLPSGIVIQIRYISAEGSLVRIAGWESDAETGDQVFVAPESVAISVRSLQPDEPRRPIGFDWPAQDEECDAV